MNTQNNDCLNTSLNLHGNSSEHDLDELWPLLYDRLRQIAARQMAKEPNGHVLQTTSVVHEAYFRLRNQHTINQHSELEFLNAAAVMMRRVLVDEHRKKSSLKRGGDRQRSVLSDTHLAIDDRQFEAVEIDEALKRLADLSPKQAEALQLMIFGGATLNQIADILSLSVSTVERRIRMARAWLRKELYSTGADDAEKSEL